MSAPPEPRANPALVGHDAAAAAFAAEARGGRLAHAWLIAGPPGVGKATFAFRAARWLLAGQPAEVGGHAPLFVPPEAAVFRQVATGAHPDLSTLEPNVGERGKKEVLRADDARRAIRFLAHTAAAGGWRVVVLDGAERADSVAVPNILLKSLEEPPARTVLLLTTAQPDRLLPTIRSRCRRIDLARLPEPALIGLLAGWLPGSAAEEVAALAGIADGSPGWALELAEGDGVALARLARDALAADSRRAMAIADRIAERRDGAVLATFFALLRRAIATGLQAAARGAAPPPWLGTRRLAEGATLWERLGRLASDTERLNLDRRQAVLTGLGWVRGAPIEWR